MRSLIYVFLLILASTTVFAIEAPMPPSGPPPHPIAETPIETAQATPDTTEAEPAAEVEQTEQTTATTAAAQEESKDYTLLIVVVAALAIIAFIVFMFRRHAQRSEMQ